MRVLKPDHACLWVHEKKTVRLPDELIGSKSKYGDPKIHHI